MQKSNRIRIRVPIAAFIFGTVVIAAPGCSLPFLGETVTVADENLSVAAAFEQVKESRGSARLGDIIAQGGIPKDSWDRMYSFDSPNTAKELNRALGTRGLKWKRLPQDSEQTTQVFLREGKVVYAFNDQKPRHSVATYGAHATPDSTVQATEAKDGYSDTRFWWLRIEEFP